MVGQTCIMTTRLRFSAPAAGSLPPLSHHLIRHFQPLILHKQYFRISYCSWITPPEPIRMSGLEVAGAVLGAFPIALIVLEEYREVARRLDRFHKIRLEYKKCRDALKYQQLTFTMHLRQLLLPLLVDDDKIDDLLSAPGGDGWKEPSVANFLRSRLLESYELYLDLVTEMKHILDHIHKELAADSEPIQQQLNASVRTNKNAINRNIYLLITGHRKI